MSAPHYGGRSSLSGVFGGLAFLLALIGMVFVAPLLWPLIEGSVHDWLVSLYGRDIARWLHMACLVVLWLLTFQTLRLVLSGLFTAAAMLIARRMM